MNQVATTSDNGGTSVNQVRITGGAGSKITPQSLGEVVRFSEVMSRADIALPAHLRGNPGACMAVAMQALEWGMSPFAVASKSYSVNGQIAYEAQLIVAVVNTRSGIEGRLKYRFEGEGERRVCIAYGTVDGEELDVKSPKFGDIKPKNSPLWKTDPDQQHCYYTGRAWARRHVPEVLLGIYDREELLSAEGPEHARDVTPNVPLTQRLANASPTTSTEGFDSDHVMRETGGHDLETGEVIEEVEANDIEEAGTSAAAIEDEPVSATDDEMSPDEPDSLPEPKTDSGFAVWECMSGDNINGLSLQQRIIVVAVCDDLGASNTRTSAKEVMQRNGAAIRAEADKHFAGLCQWLMTQRFEQIGA